MDEIGLPDGRTAQLWFGGADAGPAVLVCHGTPDTRWVARTGETAARGAGVRLLGVNRPGYGTSTATDSTPASVAADTIAVLDRLGVDRVAVLGMSVGGRYAAGLAAAHPDRVVALGLVATPRPDPGGAEPDRAEFEAWAASMAVADPDDQAVATRWLDGQPPRDAALLGGALGVTGVAASAREALAQPDGYLRDATVLCSDWGYRPEAIGVPTHLWFGADDGRNPPATGEWWAARVPAATLVVRPGTTHLATLLANWPDILATMAGYLD